MKIQILALCAFICSAQSALFETHPAFNGQKYADVPSPRGLFLDKPSGDILVLSRGGSSVIALTETENEDGSVSVSQSVIVQGTGLGLNHGMIIHAIHDETQYIYASSQSAVYRWPYVSGQKETITTPPQVVVNGIPPGGHSTRSLVFDHDQQLCVSVGSAGNVDNNSIRSRINCFNLFNEDELPIAFNDGDVFADGLRNEVGLAMDSEFKIWGVENGVDNLNRPDLGGDIHNGNPAEEMNKFGGRHYGYPYCFTVHSHPSYPAGTQFAHPQFMNDGIHTDAWCQDPENNNPPALSMPAHQAPLGIHFYDIDRPGCDGIDGGFPCFMRGDPFVSFHGSWNSDIKVGYRVSWFPFNKATNEPTGEDINILFEPSTTTCTNCLRPVDVIFDNKGRMIVSADSSNEIFRVFFNHQPPTIV